MDEKDLPEGRWTDDGFVIYDDDGEMQLSAQKTMLNLE